MQTNLIKERKKTKIKEDKKTAKYDTKKNDSIQKYTHIHTQKIRQERILRENEITLKNEN